MATSYQSQGPLAPRTQGKTYADLVDSPVSSSSTFDDTYYSYSLASRSTAHTSCPSWEPPKRTIKHEKEDNLPPSVTHIPSRSSPRASVITYNSVFSSLDSQERLPTDDLPIPTEDAIPACLPAYQPSILDPSLRRSDPDSFRSLFPSLDRLSIRHDDLTHDGNMNLRVDTVVPRSGGKGPVTVQLFHLRMHDLALRKFDLRRYCRDSGREVCNSKRVYAEPPPASRPGFQRSMSSAFNAVKTLSRRNSSSSSTNRRPSTSQSANSSSWDCNSIRSMRCDSLSSEKPPAPVSALVPTNAVKLEFGNYARVDVARNGNEKSRSYEFNWWGSKYTWTRLHDKTLGTFSFHLHRQGQTAAVAHIVPEARSPNQVEDDEWAGGWVPPCHMWISDESVLDAKTDVADVIISTGLMALVDDSIKTRWQVKQSPRKAGSGDQINRTPPNSIRRFFQRRHTEQPAIRSSSRSSRPMAA